MPVHVLIEREARPGSEDTLVELLRRMRGEAVRRRGYLYGETWRDADEPRRFVVVSVWGTREHWEDWQRSQERNYIEKRISEVADGPPSVRVYQDLAG